MYQSVSSAACCSPFDWLPALIAQMLNQPAFLMVPSGFSRIKISSRGRLAMAPCAMNSRGRVHEAQHSKRCRQHPRDVAVH